MNPAATVTPTTTTKVAAQSIFSELDRRRVNKRRRAAKSLGLTNAPREPELVPIMLLEGDARATRAGDDAGGLGAADGIGAVAGHESGSRRRHLCNRRRGFCYRHGT